MDIDSSLHHTLITEGERFQLKDSSEKKAFFFLTFWNIFL